MERIEILNNYYAVKDEDSRLLSKSGSVEFITTVNYIEKYLQKGMKILDVGAGTGRYSHYFAKKGYPLPRMRILQRYSKEVEHSYDNTEALNAEFDKDKRFEAENLIAILENLVD